MNPLSYLSSLGIFPESSSDRVSTGEGRIYARTIEIGNTAIAIDNIGSMRVIDLDKNHAATVIGVIIALLGLVTCFNSIGTGIVMLAIGIALAAWNYLRRVEIHLSIGTSDGRFVIIVSKDRDFLVKVRDFLREKIETKSQSGGVINITNSRLEGTIAVGPSANATNTNTTTNGSLAK